MTGSALETGLAFKATDMGKTISRTVPLLLHCSMSLNSMVLYDGKAAALVIKDLTFDPAYSVPVTGLPSLATIYTLLL